MSVAGYLASGKNVGLRSDRLVVRLKEDALRACVEPAEVYGRVEDYDPVLRAHCRVAEE